MKKEIEKKVPSEIEKKNKGVKNIDRKYANHSLCWQNLLGGPPQDIYLIN